MDLINWKSHFDNNNNNNNKQLFISLLLSFGSPTLYGKNGKESLVIVTHLIFFFCFFSVKNPFFILFLITKEKIRSCYWKKSIDLFFNKKINKYYT